MSQELIAPASISSYLLTTFIGIKKIETWGETSFFYNPDGMAPRGAYFCTIKEKDGENDRASCLDRKGVFRLNFGIFKTTFLKLFEEIPKRPAKGRSIEGRYNFTDFDQLCPHPVYGWMCWVAISNPTITTFNNLQKLLCESYQLACQRQNRRLKQDSKFTAR